MNSSTSWAWSSAVPRLTLRTFAPEPWTGDANAHMKDAVENFLNREVCRGTLQLVEAQCEVATDWLAVYHSRGLTPAPERYIISRVTGRTAWRIVERARPVPLPAPVDEGVMPTYGRKWEITLGADAGLGLSSSGNGVKSSNGSGAH